MFFSGQVSRNKKTIMYNESNCFFIANIGN